MTKKVSRLVFSILIVCLFSAISLMSCTAEVNPENTQTELYTQEIHEEVDVECTPISVKSSIGKMSFGKFPQSLKGDVIISKVKAANGYYLGSDSNYYVLKDGHYYLVEDVIWDAYELEDGDILLVSEKVLFSARYDDYVDYFDQEVDVFERGNFLFTEIEESLIKNVGHEYGKNSIYYSRFYDKMMFLDIDQVQLLYPSSKKILKEATSYALPKITNPDGETVSWWIAPKNGRNYYVSTSGTISNKGNTYLDTSETLAKIKYARRGIAPAIIISNN